VYSTQAITGILLGFEVVVGLRSVPWCPSSSGDWTLVVGHFFTPPQRSVNGFEADTQTTDRGFT
jgi:hypothetical protein